MSIPNASRKVFLSIAFTCAATSAASFAHADVFDEAARVLGPDRGQVLRLNPAQQRILQRYFDALNARLDFSTEENPPRPTVILIDPQPGQPAAYVDSKHPEFLFWSREFLSISPYADVDIFALSYVRYLYSDRKGLSASWRWPISPTVADVSMLLRLWRIHEDDRVTRASQAPLFHFATVMSFLRRSSILDDLSDNIVNKLEFTVFEHYYRVSMTERPTSRSSLKPLLYRRSKLYIPRRECVTSSRPSTCGLLLAGFRIIWRRAP